MPDERTIPIKIYEFDPVKPLELGKNPLPIANASIPFTERYPRRERAAKEKVQAMTGREPTIAHAVDESIIATVYVKVANGPAALEAARAAQRVSSKQALVEALKTPEAAAAIRAAMGR